MSALLGWCLEWQDWAWMVQLVASAPARADDGVESNGDRAIAAVYSAAAERRLSAADAVAGQ